MTGAESNLWVSANGKLWLILKMFTVEVISKGNRCLLKVSHMTIPWCASYSLKYLRHAIYSLDYPMVCKLFTLLRNGLQFVHLAIPRSVKHNQRYLTVYNIFI